MDSLSALLRRGARRRLAIALACVLAAAAAGVLAWRTTRGVALRSPTSDAHIGAALAREAARALTEGPREAPRALEGAGLRALAEHWSPRAVAAPAVRWTPAPLTPGALAQPREPAPAPRMLGRVQRALPAPRDASDAERPPGVLAPAATD